MRKNPLNTRTTESSGIVWSLYDLLHHQTLGTTKKALDHVYIRSSYDYEVCPVYDQDFNQMIYTW